MIHLDTSFLIRGLIKGSAEDRRIRRWLKDGEPLGLSAIVWAEFLCGPLGDGSIDAAREVFGAPVGFSGTEAELAAELFNLSGRRRGTLPDCMIAAVAMSHDSALATSNGDDFRRFAPQGLCLITPPD